VAFFINFRYGTGGKDVGAMRQSLSEIYDARVAQGLVRPDAAQHALLPGLEARRVWLEEQAGRRRGLLAGLFQKPAEPLRGMYLWGGVGRGKSMLMDLFVGTVDVAAKRRVHFHAFMQEVHRGMSAARKRGVEDALAPVAATLAAEVRLLAFDEMQINDITDAMLVGRLFQMLFAEGVMIVTTSNRPPDDLYLNGLNRALFLPFVALLKERLEVVELRAAADYRQDRLAGAQVYFHPAGTVATAALAAIWQDLTGSAGASDAPPLKLAVNGRVLVVPAFRNGVARASFWDLCAQPLGPADFLTLAGAVRVLVLEDIPELSAANYNEARRFVTLIDALYEAKVRLIASAAAAPERLYVEGTGAFEFARTASRLHEMQAAGWGTTP